MSFTGSTTGDTLSTGDRVVLPCENPGLADMGEVTSITEPDGDVDYEGIPFAIDPIVTVRFDNGDEEEFT
jgi:hypothetical protein